jgi:hypothetical protein
LSNWLQSNPNAFLNADFVPLLRYYNVRYVIFHVTGGYARASLEEARQNPDLQNMRCFEPSSSTGPWTYPICIIEVPPGDTAFNLLFREGWSGAEEWGRWADTTKSRAEWVATSQAPHALALRVFPLCVPGRKQRLRVEINGVELAVHEWQECEEWATNVRIPASMVQVGWNEVVLRSDYALRPADVTGNANRDPRPLSIGARQLYVAPEDVKTNGPP